MKKQKRLIVTYYNVKMHLLPFKSLTFSEINASKKNADMFFVEESVWRKIAKIQLIFFCTFLLFKFGMFY